MKIKRMGFTLMELLVVIAIISLLAGMIFPNLGKARIRARRAKAIAELKTIELALMDYYTEYSGFPTNLNKVPHNIPISNGLEKLVDKGYLDVVPKDAFDSEQIYRYYSCVDDLKVPGINDGIPNPAGPFSGQDLADSCLIFSVGPDGRDEDSGGASIRNFNDTHADTYPLGPMFPEQMPLSDNIYMVLPLEDIRYKK